MSKKSFNPESQLFNKYKRDARRRDINFGISESYFAKLTVRPCYYCDSEPKTVFRDKRRKGSYIYNGIDRRNNERGYLPRNCVTCCKRCNFAKARLTEREFLSMIEEIYSNHFS